MDIYTIQEEAYKRGYEAGVKSVTDKNVGDRLTPTDREKLIEVLSETGMVENKNRCNIIADELIANGVVISKNETTTTVTDNNGGPEWNLVSETPKAPGIYQVFGYDKDWEKTKVWYGQWSGCDWFVYDIYGDGKRFVVTHWMPLPGNPRGYTKNIPKTKADRIRAMSDEEFSCFLALVENRKTGKTIFDDTSDFWLEWLKQPAEVDK